MDLDNCISVSVDTFQFNAGIIGFIYAMNANGKTRGVDFDYDKDTLYIAKELLSEDMTALYVNAVLEKYAAQSIVTRFESAEFDAMTRKQMDIFDGFCKRKTVQNICVLIKREEFGKKLSAFASEKDEAKKRECGKAVVKDISADKELKEYLLLGDIFFMKFSILFNGLGFLYKSQGNYNLHCDRSFYEQLDEDIFAPVRQLDETEKPSGRRCLNCARDLGKSKIKMVFLRDCVADMDKKTSTFWSKKADTFVCPVCKMIYSFMPLGFNNYGGKSLFFVNVNDDIDIMRRLNEISVSNEEKEETRITYNSIVAKLIEMNVKYVNKMQVISKDVDNHYKVGDLSKDKIEIIRKGQSELGSLANAYCKMGDAYLNVYMEAIDNIVEMKNQYPLLFSLMRADFNRSYVLFNLLRLQIIKNNLYVEGNMDKKFSVAYRAKLCGNELRKALGTEADNKLRGFVYQLLNAVQAGNIDLFNDRIIRMYVGMQKPVPDIFINGFKGDEEFKTIGYAYIIGLKGDSQKDNNDEKENVNE